VVCERGMSSQGSSIHVVDLCWLYQQPLGGSAERVFMKDLAAVVLFCVLLVCVTDYSTAHACLCLQAVQGPGGGRGHGRCHCT